MAATPFTFTPTDFKDGSAGGTPITAAELNKINLGISQLYEALPHYVVAASTDTPPSTPCILIVINNGYQGAYYADGTTVTQIHWPSKPPITLQKDANNGISFWSNGRSCAVSLSHSGVGENVAAYGNITSTIAIPDGYRPPTNLAQPIQADWNTGTYLMLSAGTDGSIKIINQYGNATTMKSGQSFRSTISWPI